MIPNRLKAARVERGWSLREASALLGCSHTALRHWECGYTRVPVHLRVRMGRVYGRTVKDLFGDGAAVPV